MSTLRNLSNQLCSRSRELLACQKFMTILMGHMQLRKSAVDFSQLLTVEVEGCLNFSDFFFVFLGLRIFTRIYCIWSETREQNLNDLLSYNGPQFLSKNRFTYPNDLPMTSQWPQTASFFAGSNIFPSFWSELYWSDQKEGNPMLQLKKKGTLHQWPSSASIFDQT